MADADLEVIVVGGGPTGLTAAILLGAAGIKTLVLERNQSTSEEPKAVSIDDAALRTLQRAQAVDRIYPAVLQGTGTKYFGARGQLLTYARGAWPPRFGHPVKNPFQQPALERALLMVAQEFPSVEVRFNSAILGVSNDIDGMTATTINDSSTIRARYLLGCDGGRSTVRQLLGLTMSGSNFKQPWLVVDTVNDPHDERYAMHHGDPNRPHVIVSGKDGFCRYEFLLRPSEGDFTDPVPFDFISRLLRPYRPGLSESDVLRRRVYTFHAVVADQWRRGRCFLLGDAAHMMPPFAGAGLNTGMRDADNLCWKLEAVLRKCADERLLESYELERRAHANSMVRLSSRLGSIVMTTSPAGAFLRDLLVAAANYWPPSRRYLSEMRFRPQPNYSQGFAFANRVGGSLAGRVFPQPDVLLDDGRHVPLDDVLGTGFALVGLELPTRDMWNAIQGRMWDRLAPRRVELMLSDRSPALLSNGIARVASLDSRLFHDLQHQIGQFVLVRPDRVVAAVFSAREADLVAEWIAGYFKADVAA